MTCAQAKVRLPDSLFTASPTAALSLLFPMSWIQHWQQRLHRAFHPHGGRQSRPEDISVEAELRRLYNTLPADDATVRYLEALVDGYEDLRQK